MRFSHLMEPAILSKKTRFFLCEEMDYSDPDTGYLYFDDLNYQPRKVTKIVFSKYNRKPKYESKFTLEFTSAISVYLVFEKRLHHVYMINLFSNLHILSRKKPVFTRFLRNFQIIGARQKNQKRFDFCLDRSVLLPLRFKQYAYLTPKLLK